MPGPEKVRSANAFRVLDDRGADVLLDFLDFSGQSVASVVSRVRMRADAIPGVLRELDDALKGRGRARAREDSRMSINFVRGTFQEFRATTTIHLGPLSVNVDQDGVIEFDGNTVRYNGASSAMPQLKAAIGQGWFVPVEDTESQYVSRPAGVKIRPATNAGAEASQAMAVDTVSEDNEIVGTLADSNARTEAANRGMPRAAAKAPRVQEAADIELADADDEVARLEAALAAARAKRAGQAVPQQDVAPQVVPDVHGQEGVPVQRLLTPATQRTVITDADRARRETLRLDSVQSNDGVKTQRLAPTGARTLGEGEMQVNRVPAAKPVKASTIVTDGESLAHRPGGASGDVAQPRTGDSLPDLLPGAAVAGAGAPKAPKVAKPAAKPAKPAAKAPKSR